MRRILPLLVLLLIGACGAGDLTFAGIPWGSDPAEVRAAMAAQGFRFVAEVNQRGDHLYAGPYAGRSAVVVARMTEGKVSKFEVGIDPRDEERPELFLEIQAWLEQEYGEPLTRAERTAEAEAWRSPPSTRMRSVWTRTGRDGDSYLLLEDRPEVALVIAFESPAWHPEFLRRQAERR